PMQSSIPPNGATTTSWCVMVICLTPKTTPSPPIKEAIIAGTSSEVSLGAVLDSHNSKEILKRRAEKRPLISGNG
ncbi:MAG: hypothetical protein VX557_00745, partial [Candidatus Thermoplasmatota archaeon]|nr:hypothetical protein [Candidatus Thermoplasmatota archaeon]